MDRLHFLTYLCWYITKAHLFCRKCYHFAMTITELDLLHCSVWCNANYFRKVFYSKRVRQELGREKNNAVNSEICCRAAPQNQSVSGHI